MVSKNVFPQLYGAVSSAQSEKSDLYCSIKKKSIMFILNNNGRNIEPCVTPKLMWRISL